MSAPYDAIVIGAGVNGLAAASYLAMAGKRVVVLEARDAPGGQAALASTFYALDPAVMRELRLSRRGLKFVVRDMPLVGLRNDGKHLVLSRDSYTSAGSLAVHAPSDAKAWSEFRREWFAAARAMRSLWWRAGSRETNAVLDDPRVLRFARMGTGAWLDSWFESDAARATLGFDAHALSPLAAGSALLLVWRAAQEMSGLQGATAASRSGSVVAAFASTARMAGVETRMASPVSDILVGRDGAVEGAALLSGEVLRAPLVLSSLSRRRSLSYASVQTTLGFGERNAIERETNGVQAACVTLELDTAPTIAGAAVPAKGRFVAADRLESLIAAHAASQSGRLPEELTMETTFAAAADTGHYIVSVLVAPVPATVAGGWRNAKALLAAKVVSTLSHHIPKLAQHLVGVDVMTPDDIRTAYGADDAFGGPVDATRLLADWRARVKTPVDGLILCGAAADPVGAVSGRGGRMAAAYAFEREARR